MVASRAPAGQLLDQEALLSGRRGWGGEAQLAAAADSCSCEWSPQPSPVPSACLPYPEPFIPARSLWSWVSSLFPVGLRILLDSGTGGTWLESALPWPPQAGWGQVFSAGVKPHSALVARPFF